jgi:hypothetical protein
MSDSSPDRKVLRTSERSTTNHFSFEAYNKKPTEPIVTAGTCQALGKTGRTALGRDLCRSNLMDTHFVGHSPEKRSATSVNVASQSRALRAGYEIMLQAAHSDECQSNESHPQSPGMFSIWSPPTAKRVGPS